MVYDLQFRDACHLLQSFDLGRCRAVLDECSPELRGPEYGYLVNQLEKKVRTLPVPTGQTALSGDGKRLVSGSNDGTFRVLDLETGQETVIKGPATGVACLALSFDGKRLFSAGADFTIKVWDLEAGKEIRTLRGHTAEIQSLLPSGDGKLLVSGSRLDKTINVWNLETGKAIVSLPFAGNELLSSDGKWLVSSLGDTIKVWDVETGKETYTLRGHTRQVYCVALSGDSKRLFSGSADCTIKVWDMETGNKSTPCEGMAWKSAAWL